MMSGPGDTRGRLSLTVSIVLYRTRAIEIQKLVNQLLDQNVARIVLIDNGPKGFSTFEAFDVDDRVSLIRPGKNLGYGRAHNIAMRMSAGTTRYHLVCNPDVRLAPDTLFELHQFMELAPAVGLCMPKVTDVQGRVQRLCKRHPTPWVLFTRRFLPNAWLATQIDDYEMRDSSYEEEMDVLCLSGCFMFVRNSVIKQAGGFDERYFMYMEDYDLSRRVNAYGRNVYVPHTHIVHEHARGSYNSFWLLVVHVISAVRYFNKWGWY